MNPIYLRTLKSNKQHKLNSIVVLAILFANLSVLQAAEKNTVLLEVNAGKQTRENCVVTCDLPEQFKETTLLKLVRLDKNKQIAIQIDRSHKPAELVWILNDRLEKGATRQYRLSPAAKDSTLKDFPNRVLVEDDKKRINIKADGKPVLSYNHAIVKSSNRDESYYDKSGHIHPLYTPSGKVITDDFNPDHAHQHGIMFTWRKILFEGRKTNGWDQKAKTGKVTHRKINKLNSGPVFGSFTTTIDHIDLTKKRGAVTMLEETWNVRVFSIKDQFSFDINSVQKCATDQPVTIEKYHYGGMAIRGHADWFRHQNFDYLTSEGKNKKDGNHTRPQWVEMNGPLSGSNAGVTIFCHPKNFRFPQPVRLHPKMPYFCFAVSVLDSFDIKPRKPYISRYRFYIHDGKPNRKVDQKLWEDFAHPPTVKIIIEKQ